MNAPAAEQERPVHIHLASLELRVAESTAEIEAAQALRYRVFYEELSAKPTSEMSALRRDFDSFDPYCDHLIIIDRDKGEGAAGIIATYRLMRREQASRRGQFYSIDEFDISPLVNYRGGILELGRSCVDPAYRTKAAMQLMWKGIADYILHYKIGVLFGCASFPGTDPAEHKVALSYLYHRHLAPAEYRPRALPERYVSMNMMSIEEINEKRAFMALPPLIKGYLRLGGFVGDGAVIDPQFGTVDVSVIVVHDLIADKYTKHYHDQAAGKTDESSPTA
ncbi:GNAT family N-acetyltransferase [Dongia deserti]|uniref:GNAT family N-acetyltransferase n=1 Tax=Dongia deserti TaxID=2268030 RepID=UPI000E649BB2|nr:GNAT family N-acyltransferase [Dongia deserti]